MIAITAFFAPPKQKIRKKNFQVFKKNLGIPLIVVEWSPVGHFHIGKDQCDHLIQLTSGDNLWQKEALLNIGIRKAQELGYDKIAVLDADIVFFDPIWYEKVSEALDVYEAIQCFREVHYVARNEEIEFLSRHEIVLEPTHAIAPSLASISAADQKKIFATSFHDNRPMRYLGTNILGNPGLATAFNLKESSVYFYDANIVGGGDLVMFSAAMGLLTELFEAQPFSDGHVKDILSWAKENPLSNCGMGYCDLSVAHLWHADAKNRNYQSRHDILLSNNYSPGRDIVHDASGLLEFTEVGQRLVDPVGTYLIGRKEG